ncbi:MT organizer Mto2 [Schizosaccharomyces cryophilus OY26]|uniref:MT organizer Mto2 n=1 Tax=Schizosaccharomyces cryophilus (strain OY26 / ATCC MYA-4695 / CBS 11777 / NBRC 106824 / NRRL Y48691) TaxID=653667 RepID=S9VRE5_SCHCR|nr:MT organizer Mto2 [Schizosaccharomyces cryophilus OY26]EPY50518.1 MT organizer Mto2 [Schizosaccharomyces cryophilus OY26]
MSRNDLSFDKGVAEDPFLSYEASVKSRSNVSPKTRESYAQNAKHQHALPSMKAGTDLDSRDNYANMQDGNWSGFSSLDTNSRSLDPFGLDRPELNHPSMRNAIGTLAETSLERASPSDNSTVLRELDELKFRLSNIELHLSHTSPTLSTTSQPYSPYGHLGSTSSYANNTSYSPAPLNTMQTALSRLQTYHPSPVVLEPVQQAVQHAITLTQTSPSAVVDGLCRSLAELCLGLVQQAIDASLSNQQAGQTSMDLIPHSTPLDLATSTNSSPSRSASSFAYNSPDRSLFRPPPSTQSFSSYSKNSPPPPSRLSSRHSVFSDGSRFQSKLQKFPHSPLRPRPPSSSMSTSSTVHQTSPKHLENSQGLSFGPSFLDNSFHQSTPTKGSSLNFSPEPESPL